MKRTAAVTDDRRLALLADKPSGQLLVHEIYKSLQGESLHTGYPCAFVRLAVCDARCSWCDTPHAFAQGEPMPLPRVIERVLELDVPRVLVTGGEPLIQPEAIELLRQLCDEGLSVLLETSGAHDLRPVDPRVHVVMDIKCPGSGEHERNLWDNLDALKPSDEIKLVVAGRADFDWATDLIAERRLESRAHICFSPVWGAVEPSELARWLLDSGLKARLALQLHKIVWGAHTRGV